MVPLAILLAETQGSCWVAMTKYQHKSKGFGVMAGAKFLHSSLVGALRCYFQAPVFSYNIIHVSEHSQGGDTKWNATHSHICNFQSNHTQVCHILNPLWRRFVKSCLSLAQMHQSGTIRVHCTATPEMKEMPKSILWHRQNSCMGTQGVPRKLRYHSRQSCEAKFEAGQAKGRRTPNFSLNPCKYWMKCQGKVKAEKKKLQSALWNVLFLVLSQEKKHLQGINRSYFNNQLCNRTKIML